ncbi:polysaccharide deacetylase family protein [Sphingomonas sp. BIUV-7]|uniref:Chitooligosaccharide deacetylase n=1 Tax=Sphingomonas natans TaxID=3063330 RepID=A0ABT8YA28_9SPHN|nr:polysaccharide deacetylase family protein [Sphingomonas sp. BIUV-7]MDO6415186.1 polysaccharide deacetylase family protein [Sphingomonas sp. BIUV-7]
MRAAAAALALLLGTPAAAAPQIALTFDDLPSHGPLPPGETRLAVIERIVAALQAAHVGPVWGFVNGRALGREPGTAGVLEAWRAAGFPLGNHGWAHSDLDKTDAATFLNEIDFNTPTLARLMAGQHWRWFRFPYLDEGSDPAKRRMVRQGLADRGYRIAGVTMSFGDFLWNDAYARCSATGDAPAIERLEQTYLSAATEAARASRHTASAVTGRDISYVLLMHSGAFDARMLPRLIAQYRREGFRFVTLEKATRDRFYAADMDPRRDPTPSLDEQAKAKNVAPLPAPAYAGMLSAMCR